jgi:NADH-quinone oxidoreductase subunit E
MLADVSAVLGSMDIVFGEVDRMSNLDVAQKQLDAYNAQDLETYVSYFAPDCVISGLNGTPTETSRDAIKARYAKAFAQFPQNKAELKNRIAVGNTVVDHELVIRCPRRRAIRDHRHLHLQGRADQPRRFRKVGSCRFAVLPRRTSSPQASPSARRMRNGLSATIAKYPPGRQASAVISLLWKGQEQEGWVSHPMVESIAKMLSMPFIRVLEVATFYTMFNLEPVGHLSGSGLHHHALAGCAAPMRWWRPCKKHIHPHEKTVSADGKFSWMEVECLGACVNAPMLQIGSDFYEDIDGPITEQLIADLRAGKAIKPGSAEQPQLVRAGRRGAEPDRSLAL